MTQCLKDGNFSIVKCVEERHEDGAYTRDDTNCGIRALLDVFSATFHDPEKQNFYFNMNTYGAKRPKKGLNATFLFSFFLSTSSCSW